MGIRLAAKHPFRVRCEDCGLVGVLPPHTLSWWCAAADEASVLAPDRREELEAPGAHLADALRADHQALVALRALRRRLEGRSPELQAKLADLEGSEDRQSWRGRGEQPPSLVRWSARLNDLLQKLQSADVMPTPALVEAAESSIAQTAQLVARWKQLERDSAALLR